MVVKRQCSFCAGEVEPGTGTMFVKRDGQVFFFCSSSCRKQQLKLGRVGHRLKWTRAHGLKRAADQSSAPGRRAEALRIANEKAAKSKPAKGKGPSSGGAPPPEASTKTPPPSPKAEPKPETTPEPKSESKPDAEPPAKKKPRAKKPAEPAEKGST
jgi:large subunit ribosomal protein L24e